MPAAPKGRWRKSLVRIASKAPSEWWWFLAGVATAGLGAASFDGAIGNSSSGFSSRRWYCSAWLSPSAFDVARSLKVTCAQGSRRGFSCTNPSIPQLQDRQVAHRHGRERRTAAAGTRDRAELARGLGRAFAGARHGGKIIGRRRSRGGLPRNLVAPCQSSPLVFASIKTNMKCSSRTGTEGRNSLALRSLYNSAFPDMTEAPH